MTTETRPVALRVTIEQGYRNRLKLLSVAMETSMGNLVQRLITSAETLEELEQQYLGRT